MTYRSRFWLFVCSVLLLAALALSSHAQCSASASNQATLLSTFPGSSPTSDGGVSADGIHIVPCGSAAASGSVVGATSNANSGNSGYECVYIGADNSHYYAFVWQPDRNLVIYRNTGSGEAPIASQVGPSRDNAPHTLSASVTAGSPNSLQVSLDSVSYTIADSGVNMIGAIPVTWVFNSGGSVLSWSFTGPGSAGAGGGGSPTVTTPSMSTDTVWGFVAGGFIVLGAFGLVWSWVSGLFERRQAW